MRREAPQRSAEVSARHQGPGAAGSPQAPPALSDAHGGEPSRLRQVKKPFPASPWPHAGLLCAGLQDEIHPRIPQLPQQRAFPAVPPRISAKPCRPPRGSALRGTACPERRQNRSNQNNEAAKTPGAGRVGHSGSNVCREARGRAPRAAAVRPPTWHRAPGQPASIQPRNTAGASPDRDFPSAPRARGARRWPCRR